MYYIYLQIFSQVFCISDCVIDDIFQIFHILTSDWSFMEKQ